MALKNKLIIITVFDENSRDFWYQFLNNSFQCLNNNNTSNMYFHNTEN